MKKSIKYLVALLAIVCFTGTTTFAQTDAAAWVKKGNWRNGLKLSLYPGLDNAEFAKQYKANKALWDKAFEFLKNTKLDTLSVGKHLIDGENVFAAVSTGTPKAQDKAGWESHKSYIDVHVMITGKERIGVAPVATATVTKPYNPTSDGAGYALSSEAKYYEADSNTMIILFPSDAHSPGNRVDGYDQVKKVVIKIKAAN